MLQFFQTLLPRRQLGKLPSLKSKRFYERLFTPIVTLWYLIFQRLAFDHTLEGVVADAQAGGADSLCKRLSKKLLSTATVSYSNARQRLPLAFLTEALALQAGKILGLNPKARWRGLLVSLLDGSTVRMRPCGDIPKKFPPHRNQAKTPACWCLMRVVVCFCVHTGAALNCALGNTSLSEQVLACQIILCQALGPGLFIGDRNFGVFRIVQAARSAGAHVLLRMTQTRARASCWAVRWVWDNTPSVGLPLVTTNFSPAAARTLWTVNYWWFALSERAFGPKLSICSPPCPKAPSTPWKNWSTFTACVGTSN